MYKIKHARIPQGLETVCRHRRHASH